MEYQRSAKFNLSFVDYHSEYPLSKGQRYAGKGEGVTRGWVVPGMNNTPGTRRDEVIDRRRLVAAWAIAVVSVALGQDTAVMFGLEAVDAPLQVRGEVPGVLYL